MDPLPSPPPSPAPTLTIRERVRQLLGRRAVWAGLAVVVILIIGVVVWFSRSAKSRSPNASSAQLQDVSAAELKKFSDAFLSTSTTQTVTITPNTDFRNNLTVEKALTAGSITTASFNLTGATNLESVNVKSDIFVGGGSTLQGDVDARGQLTVRGALTATNASFGGNVAVAGTLSAGSLSISDLTTRTFNTISITVKGHIVSAGNSVSASPGAATGAGGSVVVSGNDTAGSIIINLGSGAFTGELAEIFFTTPFGITPHVILTPDDDKAAALQWYVTRNTGFFSVNTASAPPSGVQAKFDYFVIQ